MAKEFSFDINKALLNNPNATHEEVTNQDANYSMEVAKDIIDVFAKHNTSYEDAYLILASIADAIYLYSVTQDI